MRTKRKKEQKRRSVSRHSLCLSRPLSSLSLPFSPSLIFCVEINPDSCRIRNAKKLAIRFHYDYSRTYGRRHEKTLDKAVNAILRRTRKNSNFTYSGNPYQLNRVVHCIGLRRSLLNTEYGRSPCFQRLAGFLRFLSGIWRDGGTGKVEERGGRG